MTNTKKGNKPLSLKKGVSMGMKGVHLPNPEDPEFKYATLHDLHGEIGKSLIITIRALKLKIEDIPLEDLPPEEIEKVRTVASDLASFSTKSADKVTELYNLHKDKESDRVMTPNEIVESAGTLNEYHVLANDVTDFLTKNMGTLDSVVAGENNG